MILAQAAIVSSCLLLWGCENSQNAIDEWTGNRVLVEEAKNVESYFSQQGRLRAKLTAPVMTRKETDTSYIEFPKTMHVDFYDSARRKESWLDARYGKYFENMGKVWLRDSVRVVNVKGDTLMTPELWWDQNSRKIYTDKEVRIATKNKNIYGGKGMEANQDLTDIVIRQPSGTVLVSDNLSGE